MDTATAVAAGEMQEFARGAGYDPGLADVIIAATAKTNDLVVVTENLRHFRIFGIAVQIPVGN